jgi:hypothetical protein
MGKGQGTEGCFDHRPQENDVTSRPEKDCSSTESTVGEVAEDTKDGIDGGVIQGETRSPNGRPYL